MSHRHAFVMGVRTHVTAFVRKPLNLLLVVALPPVVIALYGTAMESFPAFSTVDPETVGSLSGAVFATAFLAGVVGLFQVISARRGDERLALCGLSRHTLLATRLVVVVAVACLAAGVSIGMLAQTVTIGAPFVAAGALLLTGVSYGLIGMLVGALVSRELEGSLLLVFLVDIDSAVSSGLVSDTTIEAFPLYHPHGLFETAVLDGTLATDHAVGAAGFLCVWLILAFVAYGWVADVAGDGA